MFLSTSDSRLVVPESVLVPQGSTVASFTLQSQVVASDTPILLEGDFGNGVRENIAVILQRGVLGGLQLSRNTVVGGRSLIGTVTLADPAPAGGLTANLSASNTNAVVPASVAFTQSETSKTFPITTLPVTVRTLVTITATLGVERRSSVLTLNP